ncbi:hypothetical protein CDL12_04717 [Handroanthus impetiginosus]|uniref:Bifunctional inhibitor/plant lipid transfer protein/seed storage helical domain-containing protein n=1 Tax=Handroanthus impetiginosus TaxID=429701 RepID=A0A2G9HYH0_9LAMI|nr:hypothetical protein CDL12_04717 [Handroanthus impetiginosus]
MAPRVTKVGIVLLVLAIVAAGAMAQQDCTSVLITMASCLNYVTGSAPTPPSSCCSSLANVVQTQPRCLCMIVNNGGNSLGVNINQTRALQLPSVCKVQTPPASRCNAVNGPAMSPVDSSEAAAPGSGDGIPGSPSVTGSKTVPSSSTTSNGSTKRMDLLQLVANIILFITASYALADFSNIF